MLKGTKNSRKSILRECPCSLPCRILYFLCAVKARGTIYSTCPIAGEGTVPWNRRKVCRSLDRLPRGRKQLRGSQGRPGSALPACVLSRLGVSGSSSEKTLSLSHSHSGSVVRFLLFLAEVLEGGKVDAVGLQQGEHRRNVLCGKSGRGISHHLLCSCHPHRGSGKRP